MAIELATKYARYVDEVLKVASKKELLTNNNFDFTGAKTVRIYKIKTAPMQDYGRNSILEGNWSHYGEVTTLDATTEEMTLTKDRSFTFEIDKLDTDETNQNLEAASALNRQIREVVIPEIDIYTYGVLTSKAGIKPSAVSLTPENIYDQITTASAALDDNEIPDHDRYLLVTPNVLKMMKLNKNIYLNEDLGVDLRKKGVMATLDGAAIIKVPSSRLPENFGFLYGHPCAAVLPVKLSDYKIHSNPPGLSGSLVEGRINYDAFILDNKANALYYQAVTTS